MNDNKAAKDREQDDLEERDIRSTGRGRRILGVVIIALSLLLQYMAEKGGVKGDRAASGLAAAAIATGLFLVGGIFFVWGNKARSDKRKEAEAKKSSEGA